MKNSETELANPGSPGKQLLKQTWWCFLFEFVKCLHLMQRKQQCNISGRMIYP